MTLAEAKAFYEEARKSPGEGLMDRSHFSELDAGIKNPFSGSLVRARYDGVAELYAHGDRPTGVRANPNAGTLNGFAPKRISAFAPEVAFVTDEDGVSINRYKLNYDVFGAGKLVFLSEMAIENLKLLLTQGVYGAPAPGQIPVNPMGVDVDGHELFYDRDQEVQWDPMEIEALQALGLTREAGLE